MATDKGVTDKWLRKQESKLATDKWIEPTWIEPKIDANPSKSAQIRPNPQNWLLILQNWGLIPPQSDPTKIAQATTE